MTETLRRHRGAAMIALLALAAALALWADINAGYRSISLDELGQIARGTAPASLAYTLVELRLPRVLTALLVGAGLSLAGCLLQGVSRNDMADPGVLGINAGAGLLVAAFIVFVPAGLVPSTVALPLLAFAGSAAVAFAGWRLSVVRGASSPRRLLLIGVALATGLSSATSLLMLSLPDGDYAFVQNWIAGNIWGATWENIPILAAGLGVLTALALYQARTLDVLGLGAAAATGLGANVPRATAARGCAARWAAASPSWGLSAPMWPGAWWDPPSACSCRPACSWGPPSCLSPTSSRARCSRPTRFRWASWRRSSAPRIFCTC